MLEKNVGLGEGEGGEGFQISNFKFQIDERAIQKAGPAWDVRTKLWANPFLR